MGFHGIMDATNEVQWKRRMNELTVQRLDQKRCPHCLYWQSSQGGSQGYVDTNVKISLISHLIFEIFYEFEYLIALHIIKISEWKRSLLITYEVISLKTLTLKLTFRVVLEQVSNIDLMQPLISVLGPFQQIESGLQWAINEFWNCSDFIIRLVQTIDTSEIYIFNGNNYSVNVFKLSFHTRTKIVLFRNTTVTFKNIVLSFLFNKNGGPNDESQPHCQLYT